MIKIMIDPGHGGNDRSNKGPTGYVEADGMLELSKKLRDELVSTGAFNVKLTRESDVSIGVRARGEMAVKWGADMLISQHSNATGGAIPSSARGVEVYYSVDIPTDKSLAMKLSKAISEVMQNKDRGAKTWESTTYPGEDYLGVIDAAQDGGVPHVFLIESGFHDNLEDEALLKNPDIITLIAKAQAKVICEFYGISYPQNQSEEVSEWAKSSWQKAIKKGVNDGLGAKNPVTEEQLMVFFDRLGLLD